MRISDWSSDVCSSDLLDIREVRQGIDGCGPHRPEAGERNHDRSQHDEQPVGDRAFDDPGDHCPLACLIALMRALLSSCTKRKLTLSPRLKPRNWAGLLVANVIVISGQPSPATGPWRKVTERAAIFSMVPFALYSLGPCRCACLVSPPEVPAAASSIPRPSSPARLASASSRNWHEVISFSPGRRPPGP